MVVGEAMPTNCTYSVVVPVYNGQASLDELVKRLEKVLARLGGTYEAILVNDGSSDESGRKSAACPKSTAGCTALI